ncbi:hypothetical protein MRX96_040039 [Rhipicephalus microplus]
MPRFNPLADATDDAIIYHLDQVRNVFYPHWKIVVNIFVGEYAAKKMLGGQEKLFGSLFAWLERHRVVDGVNFDFADDAFFRDADASSDAASLFASAKADPRWGNRTLSAMMPYAATVLLHEELSLTIDRVLVKTHNLLNKTSVTTQLAAPLDYAGSAHRRPNHRTIMGRLEGLEDNLGKEDMFHDRPFGNCFPRLSDPVMPGRPGKASFSDVCTDAPDRVKNIEDDVAYSSENYTWVSYEDQFTVFEKDRQGSASLEPSLIHNSAHVPCFKYFHIVIALNFIKNENNEMDQTAYRDYPPSAPLWPMYFYPPYHPDYYCSAPTLPQPTIAPAFVPAAFIPPEAAFPAKNEAWIPGRTTEVEIELAVQAIPIVKPHLKRSSAPDRGSVPLAAPSFGVRDVMSAGPMSPSYTTSKERGIAPKATVVGRTSANEPDERTAGG